jgi:hypothetical protein
MDEVTAIGLAWARIGRKCRTSVVMVYAALLMLLDELAPATRIPMAEIETKSATSNKTVVRSLEKLKQLQVITIEPDPEGHRPHKYKHTYTGSQPWSRMRP